MTLPPGSQLYLDANVLIDATETPSAFLGLIRLLNRIALREYSAFTSTLTIAGALVMPLRTGNVTLESFCRNRLTSGLELTVFDVAIDVLIRAAAIRAAASSAKLPDAIHAATPAVTGCTFFLPNDTRLRAAGASVVVVGELA